MMAKICDCNIYYDNYHNKTFKYLNFKCLKFLISYYTS